MSQLENFGTAVALTLTWVLVIVQVAIWFRMATKRSLGLTPLSKRDVTIAIKAGLLLVVAVPLRALGTQLSTGYEAGTIPTTTRLIAEIALA